MYKIKKCEIVYKMWLCGIVCHIMRSILRILLSAEPNQIFFVVRLKINRSLPYSNHAIPEYHIYIVTPIM